MNIKERRDRDKLVRRQPALVHQPQCSPRSPGVWAPLGTSVNTRQQQGQIVKHNGGREEGGENRREEIERINRVSGLSGHPALRPQGHSASAVPPQGISSEAGGSPSQPVSPFFRFAPRGREKQRSQSPPGSSFDGKIIENSTIRKKWGLLTNGGY